MMHKLYGQEISLFTGKARAYLRWKGINFEEVPASMATYKDVIVPRVGYPVVPVVVTPDGETLQDTTLIIDHFEAQSDGPSIYPEGPRQRLAALLMEIYGDDWLVIPAMHYRWAYNKDWAMEQLGKNAIPEASHDDQLALGEKLSQKFRGFCLPLGITERSAPAIERSYEGLLTELNEHFTQHNFLFGSRPSIGDYGLIGPLYAHQYRDPVSRPVMEEFGPNVARWVERMQNPEQPGSGSFLPDDEIPETLLRILRRMMAEQLPALESTVSALEAWLDDNPDAEIPRGIGFHEFTVGEVTENRVILSYSQWMLQRAVDFYQSLTGEALASVNELLDTVEGTAFKAIRINKRVALNEFRLVREEAIE